MNQNEQTRLQQEVLVELALQGQPFLAPDVEQLFVDERLAGQLDTLMQHLQLSSMVHVICGAPGVGKTCLVLAFLSRAGEHMELFLARGEGNLKTAQVLTDMLLSFEDDSLVPDPDIEARLAQALTDNVRETRPSVLLIDDAHLVEAGEMQRLLASIALINEQGRDGVRLVLVGRPQLAATLAGIDTPLLQPGRVFETLLDPWTELQTEAYLEHRLRMAGGTYAFTPDAIASIQFESEGLPGAVDIAAARALNRSLSIDTEDGGEHDTAPDPYDELGELAEPRVLAEPAPPLDLIPSGQWLAEVRGLVERGAQQWLQLPRAVRWGAAALVALLALLILAGIFSGGDTGSVTQPLAVPDQTPAAAVSQPAGSESAPQTVVEPEPTEPAVAAEPPPLPGTGEGPPDEAWLTGQPDDGYVIQLIGMADRGKLAAFSAGHNLGERAAMFSTRRQGSDWFVLVLGPYQDADSARAAIEKLDAPLRAQSPWIRSIASVKQAIAEQTP